MKTHGAGMDRRAFLCSGAATSLIAPACSLAVLLTPAAVLAEEAAPEHGASDQVDSGPHAPHEVVTDSASTDVLGAARPTNASQVDDSPPPQRAVGASAALQRSPSRPLRIAGIVLLSLGAACIAGGLITFGAVSNATYGSLGGEVAGLAVVAGGGFFAIVGSIVGLVGYRIGQRESRSSVWLPRLAIASSVRRP